jgi:hypothetical protein
MPAVFALGRPRGRRRVIIRRRRCGLASSSRVRRRLIVDGRRYVVGGRGLRRRLCHRRRGTHRRRGGRGNRGGGRRRRCRHNYVIIDDRILRHVDRRRCGRRFTRRGGGGWDGSLGTGHRTELATKSQHIEAADCRAGHQSARQDERARRGRSHSFASFHGRRPPDEALSSGYRFVTIARFLKAKATRVPLSWGPFSRPFTPRVRCGHGNGWAHPAPCQRGNQPLTTLAPMPRTREDAPWTTRPT